MNSRSKLWVPVAAMAAGMLAGELAYRTLLPAEPMQPALEETRWYEQPLPKLPHIKDHMQLATYTKQGETQ